MSPVVFHSTLEPLYKSYNDVIKPLIADIEARYEKFPPELFNEIRALHDHISRCYQNDISNDQILAEVKKAEGHICRTILDCYKFLNVFVSDEVKQFDKRTANIDLSSISNGEFYLKYKKLRGQAVISVREAKKAEGLDKKEAIKKFEEAYNVYSDIELLIDENHTHISRARFKYSVKRILNIILWILSAIISGLLSLFISCNNFKEFIDCFFAK